MLSSFVDSLLWWLPGIEFVKMLVVSLISIRPARERLFRLFYTAARPNYGYLEQLHTRIFGKMFDVILKVILRLR